MVAVLALSACGSSQAGAAAMVGDTRISEQQLAAEVASAYADQDRPANTVDDQATAAILNLLITYALADGVAAEQGVTVTPGAIDRELLALQQSGEYEGVDINRLRPYARYLAQSKAVGARLIPDGDTQIQQGAFQQAVEQYQARVGVEVSPRYLTWNNALNFANPPTNDLSAPLEQ